MDETRQTAMWVLILIGLVARLVLPDRDRIDVVRELARRKAAWRKREDARLSREVVREMGKWKWW